MEQKRTFYPLYSGVITFECVVSNRSSPGPLIKKFCLVRIGLREKQKSKKQYMDSNENSNIISLYFDGRKDRTLLIEELDTKRTRKEVIEEHVTVLEESGSR